MTTGEHSATRWTVNAATAADLTAALAMVEMKIDQSTGKRETETKERHQICRLLATLAHHNLLTYPLSVEKCERPDFLMKDPAGVIGIECTEAVSQSMTQARRRRDKHNREQLIWAQPYRSKYAEPLPPGRSNAIARGEYAGPPQMGDAGVRDWGLAVFEAIAEKRAKAARPKYQLTGHDWLLIYEGLSGRLDELDVALECLQQHLGEWDAIAPFEAVYVDTRDSLVQITPSGVARVVPIRSLWQ